MKLLQILRKDGQLTCVIIHSIAAAKCDKTAVEARYFHEAQCFVKTYIYHLVANLLRFHSGTVYSCVLVTSIMGSTCISLEDLDLRRLLEREERPTGNCYADTDSFNNTTMTSTTSSTADEGDGFIFVRGGTAGLVLANPCTAGPEFSVLVIEAGSDRLGDTKIKKAGLGTTLYNDRSPYWRLFNRATSMC